MKIKVVFKFQTEYFLDKKFTKPLEENNDIKLRINRITSHRREVVRTVVKVRRVTRVHVLPRYYSIYMKQVDVQ